MKYIIQALMLSALLLSQPGTAFSGVTGAASSNQYVRATALVSVRQH